MVKQSMTVLKLWNHQSWVTSWAFWKEHTLLQVIKPDTVLVNYLNNDPEINVDFKIPWAIRVLQALSADILQPTCGPGHCSSFYIGRMKLQIHGTAPYTAPCDSSFSAQPCLASNLGNILEFQSAMDNHEIQPVNISYFLLIQRLIFRNPWHLEQVSNPWRGSYTSSELFHVHTVEHLDQSEAHVDHWLLINCVWGGERRKKLHWQQYLGEATDKPLFCIQREVRIQISSYFYINSLLLVVNSATLHFNIIILFFWNKKANSRFQLKPF